MTESWEAQSASVGSFFNARIGNIYTASQANAAPNDIDFLFNMVGTPTATPQLLSYATRGSNLGYNTNPPAGAKKTYFKPSSITAANFVSQTSNNVIDALTVSATDPQNIMIEEGKVYEFMTEDGRKGLVHVEDININSNNQLDATVKIDVKAQQ